MVALLAITQLSMAQSPVPGTDPLAPTAAAGQPGLAADPDPIPEKAPGAEATPQRRKAGFLAAGGLVVLSLLVLAAGLALVRAFRQR